MCYLQSLSTMATLSQRFQYDYWHCYWSPKHSIFNTSPQPKSSCVEKLDGPITFQPLTSLFAFGLASSVPSLTNWLDDGMSILKRGIVTMPPSIHRTLGLYSWPNSWHCPFKLLPSSSQPYEDLSLWIQNDSIPTSSPTYEMTQFPPSI